MIRKPAMFLSILTLLMMAGVPVMAHHGSQGYDLNAPRKTLKGTVTRYAWENPHAQIYLDVKDDKGSVQTWAMELNNPGNLVSLGWTHSSIKAGDEVTVTFSPGKEGRPIGICVDVFYPDGRKLHSSQGCPGEQKGTFKELYPDSKQ
ncbi:MAG TPA: DUF6152 family protein [Candidatus Acidoferrales bacterium]|nr:DUF6152 family protein [Candidatus Acidoferrales bacterium]